MIYTYQNLEDDVDGKCHGKFASLATARKLRILNSAVRIVLGDADLRTAKRKSTNVPNMFNDIYDYTWPTDGKGQAVIDVQPQINRAEDSDVRLVSPEEFDRKKAIDKLMVAFSVDSGTRKIRISLDIDDDTLLISELDAVGSGGGTWAILGGAENITEDSDNFVKGSGSLNWDISAAAVTTAGIENTDLDEFDMTDFIAAGSVFCWVYITSTTGLTNFIMRFGQSATAYYYKTVTTTHQGTAFVNGWNLLRFDLQSLSSTGSPTYDACDYAAIYMTKLGTKVSETDYRFDWLVAKRGKIYDLWYYSKYGWQNNAGTWIENSTAVTDYLNADTEEYDMIMFKAAALAAAELRDMDDFKIYESEYITKRDKYIVNNPSEALLMISEYYKVQ